MKTSTIIILVVLGIIGLGAAGIITKIVLFPVNTLEKEIQISYDAQDKVLNADNAIYNYEWFKQKKQDIEASKKQLNNAHAAVVAFEANAGARSTWTFEDKTEDARLRSVELGIQNNLESQIADYNARASMATRNIFADHVLPDYIDALTFIRQ